MYHNKQCVYKRYKLGCSGARQDRAMYADMRSKNRTSYDRKLSSKIKYDVLKKLLDNDPDFSDKRKIEKTKEYQ